MEKKEDRAAETGWKLLRYVGFEDSTWISVVFLYSGTCLVICNKPSFVPGPDTTILFIEFPLTPFQLATVHRAIELDGHQLDKMSISSQSLVLELVMSTSKLRCVRFNYSSEQREEKWLEVPSLREELGIMLDMNHGETFFNTRQA